MMEKLKLTVNESKTRICRVPDESFDFLGYTIGRCWSARTGRCYIGTRPSKKRVQRLCRSISDATSARWGLKDAEGRIGLLNRMMTGWANYFCLGPVSNAYRAIDRHARNRVRRWLRRKHRCPNTGVSRFPDEYIYDVLGLVRLQPRTRNFPWAKA